MFKQAIEKAKSVNYSRYAGGVYKITTFISALVVLVICIAIVVLSSLVWPKVQSINNTVLSLQAKVNELTTTSWVDILYSLISLIVKYIPGLQTSRTDLETQLYSKIRVRYEKEDVSDLYERFTTFFENETRREAYTNIADMSKFIVYFRKNKIL
jgi:hypothetical protein